MHIGKLLSSCETPPISSENDTGTGWYCRPGGRAQPGVAAPSGRPTDRAADLNSNSWPHLKSSPFYLLGSTARVFGVMAPSRRLPPRVGGGYCRRQRPRGVRRTDHCLPLSQRRGVGDASICSSFPSRQAPHSSWPLEFGSEVGDSSILIDCLGRKPRKFVAPRLGLLPQ